MGDTYKTRYTPMTIRESNLLQARMSVKGYRPTVQDGFRLVETARTLYDQVNERDDKIDELETRIDALVVTADSRKAAIDELQAHWRKFWTKSSGGDSPGCSVAEAPEQPVTQSRYMPMSRPEVLHLYHRMTRRFYRPTVQDGMRLVETARQQADKIDDLELELPAPTSRMAPGCVVVSAATLLACRDAMIDENYTEAYHQLHQAAALSSDDLYDAWAGWRRIVNKSEEEDVG